MGGVVRGLILAAAAAVALAAGSSQAAAQGSGGSGGGGSKSTTAPSSSTTSARVATAQTAASAPHLGGRWSFENPKPTGNTMFGTSCPSPTVCYAVGDGGEVRITTNGGGFWSNNFPFSDIPMFSISCQNTNICVAVGLAGTYARTDSGGALWVTNNIGTTSFLLSVSCNQVNACWAVGQNRAVFTSTDAGITWKPVLNTPGVALDAISCLDGGACYAVGPTGVYYVTGDVFPVITYTNNSPLEGISCFVGHVGSGSGVSQETKCTAVGQNGYWLSFIKVGNLGNVIDANGGQGNTSTRAELTSVSCVSLSQCYAAGVDGSVYSISNTTDLVTHASFTAKVGGGSTGEPGTLFSISCTGVGQCLAGGDHGFIGQTSNGGTGWIQESPGYRNGFNDISCPSAGVCFATGQTVAASTDGGLTWTSQLDSYSAVNNPGYQAVSCPSTTTCFAVSSMNLVQTTDGGIHWSPQVPNVQVTFQDISCPSTTACFAVGAHSPPQGLPVLDIYALAVGFWSAQTPPSGVGPLTSISCPTTLVCFAAGGSKIIATTNGGALWSDVSPSGLTRLLDSITCPSASACFAVGNSVVLATTNGGSAWSDQTPLNTTDTFNDVSCATATACVAVGGNHHLIGTANGTTWTDQTSPISLATFYGVSCPSATACFAVDSTADVIATTDGGATAWHQLAPSGTTQDLRAVGCATATLCFAVEVGSGNILRTTDGKSWFLSANASSQPTSISCPGPTTCVAIGAGSAATTDGGATWKFASPSGGNLGISCAPTAAPTAATCYGLDSAGHVVKTTDSGTTWSSVASIVAPLNPQYEAISCPSATNCFVVDGTVPAKMYVTTDGGSSWQLSFDFSQDPNNGLTGSFDALTCPDTSTCYAAGYAGSLGITLDGGRHWVTDQTPASTVLTGVSCSSPSTCDFSTSASTVLRTTDYGNTFDLEYGNGSGDFKGVSCPGATSCFAVGSGGAISATTTAGAAWTRVQPTGSITGIRGLSCPDHLDCYAASFDGENPGGVLVTHDLGGTWTLHPLNKLDSVSAISCASVSICVAVGWPGAIYRTTDGGTTWTFEPNPLAGQDQTLLSVSCPDVNSCVAVGTQGNTLATVDGVNWTRQSSPATQTLFGITCASVNSCVEVGAGGAVDVWYFGKWYPESAGVTTSLHSVSCPSTTGVVHVCYAVGSSGVIRVTQDGGATWTAQTSGLTTTLFSVRCTQTTLCLAGGVGGALVATTDGSTWVASRSGTFDSIHGVALLDDASAWAAGNGGTALYNPTLLVSPCSTPTLTASGPGNGTAPTGSSITLTATTSGCATSPVFRFWIKDPTGAWTVVQDWQPANTFLWQSPQTDVAGAYVLEVDVRDASETTSYDAYTLLSFQLQACTFVGLFAGPVSPQYPGTLVRLQATATCPGIPVYRFWIRYPSGSWNIVQDYTTTNFYNWATSTPLGTYGLEVDVRNQGVTSVPYENVANRPFTIAVTPCSKPTLTASPASPGPTGTNVVLTASTSGCQFPVYRFWVQPPGGAWHMWADYSTSNSFTALSGDVMLGPGTYGFEVDVRDQSESVSYDAVTNLTYQLVGCSGVTLTTSPNSPQTPGNTVVLTGSATCPSTPVYRFWIRPPGGQWTIVQDWSLPFMLPGNTYTWSTTGQPLGTYGLEVDTRNSNAGDAYEAVANLTYVLAMVPCTTPTFTTNPVSAAATGSSVAFSASTSGCAHPTYRFWVQKPAAYWQIVQDYSTVNTFTWTDTGMPGSYGLEVDVRDATATVSYEAVTNLTYQLLGCSAVTIGAAPSSPQPPGGTVTVSGTASCPGTAQFRFWSRAPGGQWTIRQDYGASNTFSWATTGLALGSYGLEVDVRNVGSTAAYERVANLTYTLAVPPCNTPGLSTSAASPQATGSSITLTASTSGCASPQYRFWVQKPGAYWKIVQDYSAVNTFTWKSPDTGSVGTYGLEVDVRDAMETNPYDAVTNLTYQLNGCTAVGLTTDKASPQAHGTTITLTASSTCPGTPTYQFWITANPSSWGVPVQVYGPGNTYSWNTTGLAPGTYYIEVDVRDQGGTDSYERFVQITFVVS